MTDSNASDPPTGRATPPAEGPVQGSLAHCIEDLKNAVNAIGSLNFLPKEWPADDLARLKAATQIVQKIVASYRA